MQFIYTVPLGPAEVFAATIDELSGGTFQDLKTAFDKLAQGAHVTNPLQEAFFGVYGALNDKFGVRWMFQTNRLNG